MFVSFKNTIYLCNMLAPNFVLHWFEIVFLKSTNIWPSMFGWNLFWLMNSYGSSSLKIWLGSWWFLIAVFVLCVLLETSSSSRNSICPWHWMSLHYWWPQFRWTWPLSSKPSPMLCCCLIWWGSLSNFPILCFLLCTKILMDSSPLSSDWRDCLHDTREGKFQMAIMTTAIKSSQTEQHWACRWTNQPANKHWVNLNPNFKL